MLGPILIGAGTVVAGILGYAASRPSGFRVERSAHIDAPPDRVFAKMNDFREWPSWSPWEELDPAMSRMHSGASSGRGAVYEWSGNKKVGKGRMEIIESVPAKKVGIKLDFITPFEAHNTTEFTLTPSGGGTDVNWAMTGASNFMMKVFGVFVSMDKLVGKDFEKGLAKLKATLTQG
jgi:uncharacterized protein YndB with AHSA1/START domain